METVLPALLEQPDISIDTALPSLSAPCCVVVGFVCLSGFTRVTTIVKRKKEKKKKGRMYLEYLSKVLAHHRGWKAWISCRRQDLVPGQCSVTLLEHPMF